MLLLNDRGWTLSPHAEQRREEMCISRTEIDQVISNPCFELPDARFADRRRAFGEKIMVVYAPAGRSVITVLWRSDARYRPRTQGNP